MVMDRKWKIHLEQVAKINLASATIVGGSSCSSKMLKDRPGLGDC